MHTDTTHTLAGVLLLDRTRPPAARAGLLRPPAAPAFLLPLAPLPLPFFLLAP